MAVEPRSIQCKACSMTLATITDAGLDAISPANTINGCETCRQFRPLFDAMEVADAEYASFRDRRDNYRPKQDALLEVKRTHIEFNNWLLDVESNLGHTRKKEVSEPQGEKRPRLLSQASGTSAPPSTTSSQDGHDKDARPVRKRFRFAGEVEIRDDYRPCQNYARSDDTYVPGRYAPSEDSEHLDTSGSSKTFLKFTGMKKVGKEWVDVWKDDEGTESNKGENGILSTSNKSDAVAVTKAVPSATVDDTAQLEAAPKDARARRLARRTQPRKSVAKAEWAETQLDTKQTMSNEKVSTPPESSFATDPNTTAGAETYARARSSNEPSEHIDGALSDTVKADHRNSEVEPLFPLYTSEEKSSREREDGENEAYSVSAEAQRNEEETRQEHDLSVRTTHLDDVRAEHQETPGSESVVGNMSSPHDRPSAARTQIGPTTTMQSATMECSE